MPVTPDRDWCDERGISLGGLVPDQGTLRPLKVPFEKDECEWFVRGWEAGLYPVKRLSRARAEEHVRLPDRLDHFHTTSAVIDIC